MTTLPVSTLPSVSAKLRPLSGYERLFWAIDKINGLNFGIAVSFRGTVAHARWQAAFAQVQERHPLLDAGVNDDDPHAPFFTRDAGFPIPLAIQRRKSSADWQRVMESEVAEPFDTATGPLLRAVVLEDGDGCDLVITANHVIADGIGVIALVRDLLVALSGPALAELPVPPPSEERVAHVRASNPLPVPANAAGQAAESQPRNRTYASRNRKGKAAITALRISPEETARLLRYARREQTTIGAVLSAAAVAAVRELSPGLDQSDLRLAAAVDARPYLGNEDDFVLSIISARAIVPFPDVSLSASARAIKSQIAPHQSFEAIETTFARVGAILAQKLDDATIVNLLNQGFGSDVLVSNLKTVEFPPAFDGFVAESVWGPSVLTGVEGEHTVGTATFDGALHLVYSSFTPLPGLLQTVHKKIAIACADA
jgi:hypothetical protein